MAIFLVTEYYSRRKFIDYIENYTIDRTLVWAESNASDDLKSALRDFFIDKYKPLNAEFTFSDTDLEHAFPIGHAHRQVTFAIRFKDTKSVNLMKLKYPNMLAQ